MNVPRVFGFIGVRHARHNAEVGGQPVFVGKVADLADDAQQNGAGDLANAFNADQTFVALQLGGLPQ